MGSGAVRKAAKSHGYKSPVKQWSDLSDYRTTNYCDGKPAKLKKPQWKPKITGKGWFNIASSPGRLTPVVARIRRTTGASQDSSCLGPPLERYSLYSELHPFTVRNFAFVLPLKLDALDFRDLFPGDTHHTHIKLSGRCDNVKPEVRAWTSALSQASSEDCTISAWFRVTISRPLKKKPKKAKKGKKGKALKKSLQPRIGAPNTAS